MLIRERLVAGDDDDEIKTYLVSRYGEFVLFRPPVNAATAVLWFGPFVLLFLGALAAALYLRKRRPATDGSGTALSAEERRRLDALLDPPDDGAKR